MANVMNKPVRLAVIFEQKIDAGGGYQQSINAARLLSKLSHELARPIFITTVKINVRVLRQYGIEASYFPLPKWRRLLLKLRRMCSHPFALRLITKIFGENSFEEFLSRKQVQLVYFLSPSILACDLERINYIITVWDLCHRDDVEFPEIRGYREFEHRDAFYRRALPKATGILVDSELSKKNIILRYGIDGWRIQVLEFSPAFSVDSFRKFDNDLYVDVATKYKMYFPYIYYPAQFWAHKNHNYILEGLKILEADFGQVIGAIFSGGDQGNMSFIKQRVLQLGLSERIKFAGFVSNEEVPYLYTQSIALVMPTYFGPTNLPPLEAFLLGVPVLYPDKPGLRDQVGDAALLINLSNPRSLAENINNLLLNPRLRSQLIERGRAQSAIRSDENRLEVLEGMIKNFRVRLSCWE